VKLDMKAGNVQKKRKVDGQSGAVVYSNHHQMNLK